MSLRRKLLAFFQNQKKNLEYTELEYLESTGEQYLALNYIPTEKTGLYIKVSTNGIGDMIICGSRNDATTHTRLYLSSTYSSSNQKEPLISIGRGTYMYLQADGSFISMSSDLKVPFNTVYEQYTNYKDSKVTKFIDSTRDITSVTIPELTFTPNQPLFMFAGNIAGVANYFYKGRIYKSKVTEGDKVVMDLIPVLDKDFVPCMYDKITGKFFYNQGTGEFKWKLPNQLEYLESTGTQYIDTGFLSKDLADKSFYIRMKTTGGTSSYAYNGAYHISGTGLTIQFGLLATSDTLCRTTLNHFDPSYLNVTNLQKSEYTEMIMTPTEYWVNGEFKATHEQTSVDEILETNNPFLIFGRSQYNQPNSITPMIISKFWVKNASGKYVQYLIPAFDENLNVCMYDLVSKKYFYNKGSGTFKGYFEDGSQLVSYLSATGTQWIDTGTIPLMGDELELKNVQCKKKSSGMQAVFSAGTGSHQLSILVADGGYPDRASFYKYFATGGAKNINPPNYLNDFTTMKLESDGSIYYNGVFIIQSPPEKETDSSMRLFYRANNSSPMTGNIGAVNIKRDGKFIINLIPVVKSDNTACMFDLISKQYHVNQGSGTFSYGTTANLFNPTKPSYVAGYISTNNNGNITASTLTDTFYIPCKSNTTYLITRSSVKEENQVWRAATVSETPYVNMLCPNYVGGLTNDLALTITSRENDKYLMFSEGRTMATDNLTKFTVVELGSGTFNYG